MSGTRRFAVSVGVGVLAAGATIGAAAAGHASTPHASASSTATYLNATPHISVAGNTITASGTFSGVVRKANTRYPDAGAALYYVTVDGRTIGGPNATSKDAGCTASAPLIPVTYNNHALSQTVHDGQHLVVVSEGYCGADGGYRVASATRTVTVGSSQQGPTQPPTPSPTTTHLGVTG